MEAKILSDKQIKPLVHTWGEIKENEIITKTDVNGTVHKLLCVNGHYIATSWAERGFLPDPRISLPKIHDMEMRPDDILVCAYAKAGLCFDCSLVPIGFGK